MVLESELQKHSATDDKVAALLERTQMLSELLGQVNSALREEGCGSETASRPPSSRPPASSHPPSSQSRFGGFHSAVTSTRPPACIAARTSAAASAAASTDASALLAAALVL